MREDHLDPYGDHAFQWATVSMLYGDTEAYIARETNHKEDEWKEAVAMARADGFLGEVIEQHKDEYEDGNDVVNFVVRREAQV